MKQVKRADLSDWVVLIVDDHPDNLAVAVMALKFHGAEVHTAVNGREGMTTLRRIKPTLILLDLAMPVMNGYEMLTQIKKIKRLKEVPVVAITAHAMSTDKKKVLEKGFDAYITKPYDILELISKLQEIVAKKKPTEVKAAV